MKSPESLYIHVPFCRHRCGYCNFTLVANRDQLIEHYLRAIEIEVSRSSGGFLKTVFVGGGTPTHLAIEQLSRLFEIFGNKFEWDSTTEFSIEGNPMDFDDELVEFLHSQGVNRVSLGVQSFKAKKLEFLERDHDEEVICNATAAIRKRIENLSIDLIIGTANESRKDWQFDLESAVACDPTHVSTYSLTIEKGTQFWNRENRNQRLRVDEEMSVELYEQGIDFLQSKHFKHYEVSNFSKRGFECAHNQNYWNANSYFGFGPGAAWYVDGVRGQNHQSTSQYIKLLLDDKSPTVERDKIGPDQSARERLIFGLRQLDGIDLREFEKNSGFAVHELVGGVLNPLLDEGLLEIDSSRLRLTRKGLLISDSIWPEFI